MYMYMYMYMYMCICICICICTCIRYAHRGNEWSHVRRFEPVRRHRAVPMLHVVCRMLHARFVLAACCRCDWSDEAMQRHKTYRQSVKRALGTALPPGPHALLSSPYGPHELLD